MTSVAVYIGSFNPPHVSHVLAATYVLLSEPVDQLIVVPVYHHAFGKRVESFDHRFAMCQRAFGRIRGVEVSTVERDLGGESRTLHTLQALASAHPAWALRLVIGSDQYAQRHDWLGWDEIAALAPPLILVREGYPAEGISVVWPEIAARDVRAAIARGEDVSASVPRTVLEYVEQHSLYAVAAALEK